MDDLIEEFIDETTESLSVLDLELIKLEKNPSNDEILSNIFHIVHTIKGTCGFLGLPRLEAVAHASEIVLGKIRDHKLEATEQAVRLMMESLNCIQGLINHLSHHGQEPAGEDSALIARLNWFAETGKADGGSAMPAPVQEDAVSTGLEDFSVFFKGDNDLDTLIAEYNARSIYVAQPTVPTPVMVGKIVLKATKPAGAEAGAGDRQAIFLNPDAPESLARLVGELVLTRNQLQQVLHTHETPGLMAPVQQLSHITSEMREAILNMGARLPAIMPVLIVEACGEKFALPQEGVVELLHISPGGEHKAESLNGAPVMRRHGKLLPLGALSGVLRMSGAAIDWPRKDAFVAVCKVNGSDFGLVLDRACDVEEIIVKPVSAILRSIPVYSGNAISGDGSVIMVMDMQGLAAAIGSDATCNQSTENESEQAGNGVQPVTSFLVFASGKGVPKAMPLELVSRLEEIEIEKIEVAGGLPVVQYRGELMRLMALDGSVTLPASEFAQVIVLADDRKKVGLLVDRVIDIVHAPRDIQLESLGKGLHGSMVVEDRTVDLVDVMGVLDINVDNAGESKILQRAAQPEMAA